MLTGRKIKVASLTLLPLLALLYLLNASWVAPRSARTPSLLAHRGVHQTYHRRDLKRDTCTATRIHPPEHAMIENTVPSIRAAFEYGAEIVEIDVHPTTDGSFAVFHDWTLDCRTNGTGVTRAQTLEYLKTLDVGYGYTHDGGSTFPLRGKGVGLMPSLREVLDEFPEHQFLINIKSNDPNEADLLAKVLNERPPAQLARLLVYGGEQPTHRLLTLVPSLRGFTRASVKECFAKYMAFGWLGLIPESCGHTVLLIPINYAGYLWGWPRRFLSRMDAAGSLVFVVGPLAYSDSNGTPGIDDDELLKELPSDFDGGVWTNRIELIAPAFQRMHRGTP